MLLVLIVTYIFPSSYTSFNIGIMITFWVIYLLSILAVYAYRDVELVPGKRYAASNVKSVHNLIRKYMRYSTAASSFVELANGWRSCGLACNSPDVRNAMLNYTWHTEVPLSDGFVGVHHEDKEIVVGWAGTHRYRALLTDMTVMTLPYLNYQQNGMEIGGNVHGGFLVSVRGVIDSVADKLTRLARDFPSYMVVFTGHSKGGAEAALSALDLIRRIEGLKGRLRVWSFGAPRLGDTMFASFYNRVLGPVTYRVTSMADPVVEMPPQFLFDYCHHSTEIWLSNANGDIYVGQNNQTTSGCQEDPLASKSVDFYDRSVMWHKNYLGLPPPDHRDALFSW